jgi:hypothetical protein
VDGDELRQGALGQRQVARFGGGQQTRVVPAGAGGSRMPMATGRVQRRLELLCPLDEREAPVGRSSEVAFMGLRSHALVAEVGGEDAAVEERPEVWVEHEPTPPPARAAHGRRVAQRLDVLQHQHRHLVRQLLHPHPSPLPLLLSFLSCFAL